MTRYLIAALSAILLSGCSTAGLNVSWHATASYNSNVAVTSKAVHQTSPVQEAVAPAAAASAAK